MNMTEPTQFIAEGLRGTLRCDVDMSRHVSWRAGGRVERMYQPATSPTSRHFCAQCPPLNRCLQWGWAAIC